METLKLFLKELLKNQAFLSSLTALLTLLLLKSGLDETAAATIVALASSLLAVLGGVLAGRATARALRMRRID